MFELFTTPLYFICCLHSNKVYRFITLLLLFYVLFLFESYNIWLFTTKPYMDVGDKFPRNSRLKYILNPLTMIPITGITGFLTVYFLWGLFNKILIVLFRSLTLIISFITLLCLKNKNAAPSISIAILIISGFDIFYLKRAEISTILFTLSIFPVLNKFLRNSLTLKLVYFELSLYKDLRDFINRELKSKNWGRYACNYFANEIVVINTKVICFCKPGKQDILPDNINNFYEINGGLVRILENSNNFTVVFENTGKESYTFNTRNKGELVKSKLLTSLHFWRENPNLGIFDENPKVTAAIEDTEYIVAHCISPENYEYFINNDNVKFSVENLSSNHPYLVLGREKKKGGKISKTVNSSENSLYMSKMFGLNPDLSNIIEEYSNEFKKDCGASEIAIMLIKSKAVLFKPVCFRNSEFKLFCSDLNRLLGLMILKGKRGGSKFISNCSVMGPSLVCEKFINEIKSKWIKQYIRSPAENDSSYKKGFKDRNLERSRRLTVDLKRPEIEKEETEVSMIKETFNLIMDPEKGIKKLLYSDSTNFTSVEIGERPTGEIMDQEIMKKLLSETEGPAKFRYDQILKKVNSSKGNSSKSKLSNKSIEFLRDHGNKVEEINNSRANSYKLEKWERERNLKNSEREREIRFFCESKKSELSFNFYKKTFKRISGDRTVSFETLKDSALKLKNQFEVLDLVNENGDLSLIEDMITERKKKLLNRREKILKIKNNMEEGRIKGKGKEQKNVIPRKGEGKGKGSETTEAKKSDKNKNKNGTHKGVDINCLLRNHFKDNEGLVSKVKEDFVNKICKRRCRKVNSILKRATLSEIIKSLINRERTIKPSSVNKIEIKITSSIWKEWDLKTVFVSNNDGSHCEIREILNQFFREYLDNIQVYFEVKSSKLIKKYGMI